MEEEMELKITARNTGLNGEIKSYAEQKLSKLTRYSTRIIEGELAIEESHSIYRGELLLKVKGKTLVATAEAKDPLTLVDLLKDIMKGRLRTYEAKMRDYRS